MTTTQNRPAPAPTVLDQSAIEALPWLPLEGFAGVSFRLMWRSGKSVAGMMHVAPGAELSPHEHRYSHHHMWVLDGYGTAMGRPVTPGTYLHIPAGVEHGLGDVGPQGCTFLYLYLRDPSDDGADEATEGA
ncbi:MAG TPA: cupin domain-containing protein [Acidimicrobiales bacterium]|nr:cupin domain-containing protein [Acidimicrobiales bacterium]